MALSPAERQQRRRDKLKDELKAAPDAASGFITGSFAKFLNSEDPQELSFINETLDSVGMHIGTPLTTDKDPDWRPEWGTENRGSLGRAERMVDAFIDSARALAELINRFKLAEIDGALERLERQKLSSKADKKKAFDDAVRLNEIRTRLTKEVRHTFPQHTVKGG